jgi:uncharacterized protein YgbK (DUF1537 family)
MQPFILVLADDVTGANDTGIQYAKRGFRTLVWNDIDAAAEGGQDDAAVVVLNVNTRAMNEGDAVDKLRADAGRLRLEDYAYVYKKIDSAMRGHVVAEIEVLMETGAFDVAVIAPAYPDNGRTTAGGYHFVGNELLEDSAAAKDPHFPIAESHLPRWIRKQTRRLTSHLELAAIRGGGCSAIVNEWIAQGTELLVCDAVSATDLRRTFHAVASLGRRILWVGSAGLASVIAGFESERRDGASASAELPVLVAAGSVHPVTRSQLEVLAAANYEVITADPVALLDPSGDYGNTVLQRMQEAVRQGNAEGYVLTTEHSEDKRLELLDITNREGLSPQEVGAAIASEIGRITQGCLERCRWAGVILTGGDIAMNTFKHASTRVLEIVGEAEEGIPLCVMRGSAPASDLFIATKSGGFGTKYSLLHTARMMKHRQRGSVGR